MFIPIGRFVPVEGIVAISVFVVTDWEPAKFASPTQFAAVSHAVELPVGLPSHVWSPPVKNIGSTAFVSNTPSVGFIVEFRVSWLGRRVLLAFGEASPRNSCTDVM